MPAVAALNNTQNALDVTAVATTAYNPGAGVLAIAFIALSDYIGPVPPVQSNTSAVYRGWDFVGMHVYRTSLDSVMCFVSTGPGVDVGGLVVTATLPVACTGYCFSQAKVSGMSRFGRAAVRQFVALDNLAAGGTPEVTFGKACLTGNPVLSHVANGTNPAAVTRPAGWALGNNVGHATPNQGATWASLDSGFTGPTVTWVGTSATDFGVLAVELDATPLSADDRPPLVAGWGGTR